MTARLSLHAATDVRIKQRYWPADPQRPAFYTTDITINADGSVFEVELFSESPLMIAGATAPASSTEEVAA